jgi:hypothetical protein
MNYLRRFLTRRVIFNNLYNYSANMKRSSQEALAGQQQDHHSDGEEDGSVDAITGEIKRVNMPKKSKHRTRAHVNPMGDLNIPT